MKDTEKQLIGLKIKNLRKNKNMNLQQFADDFSEFIFRDPPYSKSTINQWECGRKMPAEEILKDICRYYRLDDDYLKIDGSEGIRIKEAGDIPLVRLTSLNDIWNFYPVSMRKNIPDNTRVYIRFRGGDHKDGWYDVWHDCKLVTDTDAKGTEIIPYKSLNLRFTEIYLPNNFPIQEKKLKKYKNIYIKLRDAIDDKAQEIYNGWYSYNKTNNEYINNNNGVIIRPEWLYETSIPYPTKVD